MTEFTDGTQIFVRSETVAARVSEERLAEMRGTAGLSRLDGSQELPRFMLRELLVEADALRAEVEAWRASPPVHWACSAERLSSTMEDGTRLECLYVDDTRSRFRMWKHDGTELADVMVFPTAGMTTEDAVTEIGAALYWSHRRALILQAGTATAGRESKDATTADEGKAP